MNAFGQFFDTAVNSFGVDFNSQNNAFGLNGFNPAPAPPSDPLLADYDFNFYTANDGNVPNQAMTVIQPANIFEPALNTFDDTDANNKFLTIYAPFGILNTGGIAAPSMTAKCVELWLDYRTGEPYAQYFLDFRTGLTDGFWITADGGFGEIIGTGQQGADVYANTTFLQQTTTDQPALATFLAGKGWYQIVVNYPNAFTDDLTFLSRFDGTQGFPISVGQICVYDRNLTQGEITTIFNNKCARYGLSPV